MGEHRHSANRSHEGDPGNDVDTAEFADDRHHGDIDGGDRQIDRRSEREPDPAEEGSIGEYHQYADDVGRGAFSGHHADHRHDAERTDEHGGGGE